ncbi:MAG: metallophosphoesterase family protein [Clostridia bacterium]|nr:metallophosphoesterase family protein [Clostridia bacterium]
MIDKDGNFYKPERGSTAMPDHIFISFCGDARTEICVSWRTDEAVTEGYVLYGESTPDQKAQAISKVIESDIDRSCYHWAIIKNLTPGTKYVYTVGDDENRKGEFSFETQPDNLEKFKFMIITDHQKGFPMHKPDYSILNRMLKKALSEHTDCRFIFTAGDNCDNGQNDLQWNGMFSGLEGIAESIPYMMTTGNHDNRGFLTYFPEPVGKFYLEHADFFDAQFEYSYPTNGPEGYTTENYSFDYGNAHFIVMGINAPEIVGEWAYEDLQKSDKTWKFGGYHFPIYPVMPEGQNDDGYPWLRKPIEDGRLDVLFEGHEHSFARTFPTKGDELFDRPSQGTVHYIAGNAGGNIYHSNCPKVWHSCFFPQEERTPMYCIAEVDGNRLTITAYMEDGRIADVFTIDKEKDLITPYALAPVYDEVKMAFKGRMLELCARGITPEYKDGIWYAAFGVLIQSIGGAVLKEKGKVTVEVYGHRAVFEQGSDIAQTDKGAVKMAGEVYLSRNQLYIPVDDSAKMFGLDWYYAERNGFINWNTPSEDKPLSKQPE